MSALLVLLTVAQVAKRCQVDPGVVYAWLQSGQLAGINVTEEHGQRRRWRVSEEALQAFLEARSNRPAVKPARKPKLAIHGRERW